MRHCRTIAEIQKDVRHIKRQIERAERSKKEAIRSIQLWDQRIAEEKAKLPKLIAEARAGFDTLAEELGIEEDDQ